MTRFFGLGAVGLSFVAIVAADLVACSSNSRQGFGGTGDDAGSSGNPGGGGGGFTSDAAAGDSGNADGCSDEAKLVYVLSLEGDLYSFKPDDKKFTKVGPLDCGKDADGDDWIPISMAVDRSATAWVNMRPDNPLADSDTMFKVDTKTAACTATSIQGNIGGMGFSTNAGTTDQETLFVIGSDTTGTKEALVSVDFTKQTLNPVSTLPQQVDLELTGTGDGHLFGFLITNPLALVEVDKASAAFSDQVSLPDVQTPQAPMFAFSAWGGAFYFYTATSQSASKTSTVSKYDPAAHTTDGSYMTQIGFHIVGAGVSTCAPTSTPH